MGYIIVAKETYPHQKGLIKIFNTNTDKFMDMHYNDVIGMSRNTINFEIKNKRIVRVGNRYNPSTVRNNKLSNKRTTLLSINEDGSEFRVITPTLQIENVSLQEYIEARQYGINNENSMINENKIIVNIKDYNETLSKDLFLVIDKETNEYSIESDINYIDNTKELDSVQSKDEDKTVSTEIPKVEITDNVENDVDNISDNEIGLIVKNSTSNQDDKDSLIAEIEKIENLVSDDKNIKNTSKNNLSTSDIEELNSVIWNMYPNDRITMQMDKFNKCSHVILRVLDSDMSGNIQIALEKIFKETRSKCTFALVKYNYDKQLVTVNVLGQSDIPDKAMEYTKEEFCMKYAAWLSETKYVKVQ